jgi:hypothetical protein
MKSDLRIIRVYRAIREVLQQRPDAVLLHGRFRHLDSQLTELADDPS